MTTKKLPGRRAVCRACRAEIRWARTLASPSGAGGKPMPLDAEPNEAGNVAVRPTVAGALVCRVLGKDETHDTQTEQRAMPHFATCEGNQSSDLISGAEALLAEAAAAGTRARQECS